VKEKQDGQGRDCPPPVLHSSSTETVASSQDQPEISSSLGNSVGGKERKKRNVAHVDDVDVVFDGVGHDSKPRKIVEKRVLVNISIVLDGGFNAKNQDIYQLQVAVPLPKDKKTNDFYSYNVENDEDALSINNTTDAQETTFTETSSQSTDETSSFTEFDGETEGLKLI
jgi:hypothetical protein